MAKLNSNINPRAFNEWLEHPITKYVLETYQKELDASVYDMLSIDRKTVDFFEYEMGRLIGKCQALTFVVDLEVPLEANIDSFTTMQPPEEV